MSRLGFYGLSLSHPMLWALVVSASGLGAAERPNLLLVTVDTLRADRLAAYGHAIETPATDQLAGAGVVMLDATVQVPQTRPSHASLLTGLLPYEHGLRDNFSPPLGTQHATLASVLSSAGYETAAFIGALPLTASSGLDRGFDHFDDPFGGPSRAGEASSERRGESVVTAALGWLAAERDAPFFAWVHLYDPHAPYDPLPPYRERYASEPYDGEVAYSDAQIGRLVGYLDARGWSDSTIVVVTSDHGEGLGEHGEEEHLLFVYDSTLRVPMILRWPGQLPAGARVGGQFRSIDLMPTLLELMRVDAPPSTGISLASPLRQGVARLPSSESYAESLFGNIHFGYAPVRSLRGRQWKYIEAPRAELYDLDADPGETSNVIETNPRIAEGMQNVLAGYDQGEAPADAAAPQDAGVMARMAALGYIGSTGAREGASKGADPKDKVADWQAFQMGTRDATRLVGESRFDEALPILERLASGETVSFEVESLLGQTLIQKGRPAEAIPHLENARKLLPDAAPTYVELARALRETGQLDSADRVIDQGLAMHPEHAALHRARGFVAYSRGDLAAAATSLERARDLVPTNARIRLMLSAVYRDRGELAPAIVELRAAVAARPDFGDGWNALGILLGQTGDEAGSVRALEQGREANPADPDILFNLASAYTRSDRAGDAVPLLESVARSSPRYPGVHEALSQAQASARAGSADAPVRRLRMIRVSRRQDALDVTRRLEEGESFATLARELSIDASASQGGDLGDVKIVDLAGALQDLARALSPGQASPVIETRAGYVILWRES